MACTVLIPQSIIAVPCYPDGIHDHELHLQYILQYDLIALVNPLIQRAE